MIIQARPKADEPNMSPANRWRRIELHQGDITTFAVDAIVNAANSRLAGGGGVDGAIHRAAGPQLPAACARLGGCATGDAKLTPGFNLPARFVIHAVGPVYRDGSHGEPQLLASCYRRSLEIAAQEGLASIAFPAISTGVYGYPFDDATRIALRSCVEFLSRNTSPARVLLVFFGKRDFDAAERILAELAVQN